MAADELRHLECSHQPVRQSMTDMEYGGTPFSRAVINVNVAFQELAKR